MRAVRGRNNASTERRFKALLAQRGIRTWRLQDNQLPGRPDFTFPKKKLAVFLDGCFWHGCPTCYRRPHSNKKYWDKKVARNKARDVKAETELTRQGWRAIRLWEHEVLDHAQECVDKLLTELKQKSSPAGIRVLMAAESAAPYGKRRQDITQRANFTPATPGTQRTFADFFAGIGLMRMGLERQGWSVLFANDIDSQKYQMYSAHFEDAQDHYFQGDIHKITVDQVPTVILATASFPCNDLSLAGSRSGLSGKQSSAFWGFIHILERLATRRPPLVLLENVTGFLTSHGGMDFKNALLALNTLGYTVDTFILDAARFVPQSRLRIFVVGVLRAQVNNEEESRDSLRFYESDARPRALANFILQHPEIRWNIRALPTLPQGKITLKTILEEIPESASEWWSAERGSYLLNQMSSRHREVANRMIAGPGWSYGTVFRRIRNGKSMAELRTDGIAGCLRTPRGGSGRQILFKAGKGKYFARLLSPRECARLMGADNFRMHAPLNQALFGFGDAVCVPVIEWIAKHYLNPVVEELFRGHAIARPAVEVSV